MDLNNYLPPRLRFNLTGHGIKFTDVIDTNGTRISITEPDYNRLMDIVATIQQSYPEVYQNLVQSKFRIMSRRGFPLIPYKYDMLSGPVSFSYLTSDVYDMRVILIGDKHIYNREHVCPDCEYGCSYYLTNFLETVIRATGDTVDFFIEYTYIKGPESMERISQRGINIGEEVNFTISDVSLHFYKCLQVDKQECRNEFSNLRLHYTDYRDVDFDFIQKINSLVIDSYIFLSKYSDFGKDFETIKKNITQIQEFDPETYFDIVHDFVDLLSVIRNIGLPVQGEELIKLYRQFFYTSKINKQLRNIPDQNLAYKIEDYMLTLFSREINKKDHNITGPTYPDMTVYEFVLQKRLLIPPNMDRINPSYLARIYISINTLSTMLLLTQATIMDAYLLGRLFRTFSDAPRARNVIIYAGDVHIIRYFDFLTKVLGFEYKRDITRGNMVEMCLDISDYKQPFFV